MTGFRGHCTSRHPHTCCWAVGDQRTIATRVPEPASTTKFLHLQGLACLLLVLPETRSTQHATFCTCGHSLTAVAPA